MLFLCLWYLLQIQKTTMAAGSHLKFLFWLFFGIMLPGSIVSGYQWYLPPLNQHHDIKFEQKVSRFWEFKEGSKKWVEISLPFDLLSCVNESCSTVGSIEKIKKKQYDQVLVQLKREKRNYITEDTVAENSHNMFLPLRKRMSIMKMSEASIWVTGQSGAIYERFWNGVQWVIAPHELPTSAGHATSVFIVNQTILALSEAGILYELQLSENSQPVWSKLELNMEDAELSSKEEIKSGVVSHDGEKLYLASTSGLLLELSELQPLRWSIHGRPPGADVASIVDAASLRSGVVFTVSSTGKLYEFDKNSKPSWKKHIWSEASIEATISAASRGCSISGLVGSQSQSLLLLSKDGSLMERRLHQRKWKWVVHGNPDGHHLSAITAIEHNEFNEKNVSLFCTTSTGSVFEYQLSKHSGITQGQQMPEHWLNHMHPQHAKVARGIQGIQLQFGRIIFLLDDGRLGELHLSSIGGEGSGPAHQISMRRKAIQNYEWSILEAPETEGWNAEYCTEKNGPANCIAGTKDIPLDNELDDSGSTTSTRRWKSQERQIYLSISSHGSQIAKSSEKKNLLTMSININFRMRTMHAERSFFLVTESGLIFEYLYTDNIWLWLRHEYAIAMKGAVGNYNGSIYLVDVNGNLLIRERSGNELSWINCTSMKKGRQVATGPPWDGIPGKDWKVTAEDTLFFVNKKGRLLQFTVSLRKFKWKDCQSLPNTKIAYILDQGVLRMNIVFVVGRNGRLYQYNKVTELWHEHYQSPHLVLSRGPGTTMRLSPHSLTGGLFMILDNGGLVEYHWNSIEGWNWVEHGTPNKDVTLVGAPGPCFEDGQLFLIGSDGHVYERYLEDGTWKWASHQYPRKGDPLIDSQDGIRVDQNQALESDKTKFENDVESIHNCDEKVAAVRPIPFSEHSVIFELRDGRLAELRRSGGGGEEWEWSRIIGTPTSPCLTDYWTALAS